MTNTAEIARLTNDALDAAIVAADAAGDGERLDLLFADRSRRCAERQAQIAVAEARWQREADGVDVTEGERLRALVGRTRGRKALTWSQAAAKAVGCPDCHAAAGGACKAKDGGSYHRGRRVHSPRIQAFHGALHKHGVLSV